MKKLRFTAILLAALICFGAVGVFAAEYDAAYDVNGDEMVNTKDLTRLMRFLAGESVETYASDITGDGNTDTKDLTRLMKYIAGMSGDTPSSSYTESFDSLVSWISANGEYTEGAYAVSEIFEDPDGSVYAVSLAYSPDEKAAAFSLAFVSNDADSARYGLMDVISIALMSDSGTTDKAEYIFIYDNAEIADMACYVTGEFSISGFDPNTAPGYTEAYFGDWDEAGMLDYIGVTAQELFEAVDWVLEDRGAGVSVSDLGFAVK